MRDVDVYVVVRSIPGRAEAGNEIVVRRGHPTREVVVARVAEVDVADVDRWVAEGVIVPVGGQRVRRTAG